MFGFQRKVKCQNCGASILPSTAEKNHGLCAPCQKKNDRDRFLKDHAAKPGCPCCDGHRFINFNWSMALRNSGHEIDKYPKYLVQERPLKKGFLYNCPKCSNKWYLDEREETMSVIPKERTSLLQEWDCKQLLPAAQILEIAQQIGATPPDIYGNGSLAVQVPCEVTTTSGEHFEKAILSFQSGPPIEQWHQNVHLLDEISSIKPSAFALSKKIRYATTQADEIRMGYAPTKVQDSTGRFFILNWTTNFFDYEGVKGESILLSDSKLKDVSPTMPHSSQDIHYFIGDWFSNVETLRIKQSDL